MVIILCIQGFLWHEFITAQSHDAKDRTIFVFGIFPAILEVVFSLLLSISACYIATWVVRSTGKKQNTCLLIWHIVNLLVLIVVNTLVSYFYKLYISEVSSDEKFQYEYNYYVAAIAETTTEFYVDLFLLWLLYRFMKP